MMPVSFNPHSADRDVIRDDYAIEVAIKSTKS